MADNGEVNDKETVKKRSANESKKALVKKEKKPKKKREKPDPAKAARQKEKRVITKNVIVISFGFLFLFTAFQSLQNLQSSLNPDEGLGLASLCVIYASLILSCMFVPPFLIGRLGCKWTLVLAMTGYVLYTVANYHASWYTLMPASILLGLCAAPLWSAKCAYLTTTGIRYSEISTKSSDDMITRYFGIFFLIFQSGQIWGNLISSLVLQQGTRGEVFRENAADVCGANFCGPPPAVNACHALNLSLPNVTCANATSDKLPLPARRLVYTMLGIYVGCGILAIFLVMVLVDRLTGALSREKQQTSSGRLLIATLRHLKDRRMQLLLPLTFYSGLEQAFIFGDFTAAFVTCSIGIHRVGFVMICFGVSDALFSFSLGRLTEYTGRIPVFISGLVVHVAVIITMLVWRPDAHLVWVFYLLAALQGYCDAVWQTQINALYGVFFSDNQEAAFSNYRLWESLGFVVAFAYSNFLCVQVKLLILLAVLLLGMALYFVAEVVQKRRSMGQKGENQMMEYPLGEEGTFLPA